MTTPRFLFLPGLIVNVDEIVSIQGHTGDRSHVEEVLVHTRTNDGAHQARCTLQTALSALREALKAPKPGYLPTDIAAQTRETREAGQGEQ